MEGNDLVSIVVPVYNSEAYLARCIRSLRLQSYSHLEIILVDDGSTDRSLEICNREAWEDSRIQVLHKKNGGASSARNAGLDQVTGQWLLLIDGDDYIHKDMVATLLDSVKACHAQTAICGFSRVYGDQSPPEIHEYSKNAGRQQMWQGTLRQFSEELFLPLYENLMLRTQSNKLYWVPLIQKHQLRYPEGISINEDIWFCVRYLTFCERIACIPGSYLYYWQDSSQNSLISRYHPEGVESCFLLLRAMEEFMEAAKSSQAVRRRIDQEMLFHICGFAGHSYYRTIKPLPECYQEINDLARREEFQDLIQRIPFWGFKTNRVKNQAAAFLLGHHWCRLYHWLCLGVYGRQRQALKRKRRKDRAAGANDNMIKQEKSSDEILVSVSCITFNHENYIARALDSFLMQKTNFNFEILVYDDASTDRTQEIIREYEKKYPDRIKPYYQKENQYSQGKYNVEGFFNYPRANGRYIAMCDGDDYWTYPNKLQLQVNYMENHPECAMCLHSAKIETQEKAIQSLEIRPYRKNRLISPEEVIDKASNYPTASLLFRTEYTRDLKDYYYTSPVGDIPIQLHMAAKGTVFYLDRKMSAYQQGVSVSWSALMKQGDYKQNLIEHHNAMKVMYRGFSKETGGIYDSSIQRACRRMDFLTYLNVKEYKKVLAIGYRSFYQELDLRTRFFIRFEIMAPGLYRFLRKLAFGKDRC